MREKDFQVKIGHWIKSNIKHSVAFELKSVRTDSLPFNAVKPHQIAGLYHVKHGNVYLKLPDSLGLQWPFDCFTITGGAYVVIRYGSGHWFGIDIDVFIKESKASKRKSLTEERATAIATFCG